MQRFKVGNVLLTATGVEKHRGLRELVAQSDLVADADSSVARAADNVDIELHADELGLSLKWNRPSQSAGVGSPHETLRYHIDVAKLVNNFRSFPAPKQGAFNQALGKKSRHIIDATGGWGGDALLMCTQGYSVTLIERQPIMALMLADAMRRLARTEWALDNNVGVPSVVQGDSITELARIAGRSDCVYLDPMFPPKKKRSAAVNKNMQLLHWLVGQDMDAAELVETAIAAGANRVVVKRPDYAVPLYTKPSVQFSSKLVHYDVYLATEKH